MVGGLAGSGRGASRGMDRRSGGCVKWRSCIPSQGKKLWAYRKGKLRSGYPKLIEEMFPGIPADLDAAVECHPKECPSETILFFKGEKGSLAGRSKGRSEASVPRPLEGGVCSFALAAVAAPSRAPPRPPPALTPLSLQTRGCSPMTCGRRR